MSEVQVIGRIEADVSEGGWKASGAVIGDADRLDFYQQLDVWFDLYVPGGWEALPRPGGSPPRVWGIRRRAAR